MDDAVKQNSFMVTPNEWRAFGPSPTAKKEEQNVVRLVTAVAIDPDTNLEVRHAKERVVFRKDNVMFDGTDEDFWHLFALQHDLGFHNAKRMAQDLGALRISDLDKQVITVAIFGLREVVL